MAMRWLSRGSVSVFVAALAIGLVGCDERSTNDAGTDVVVQPDTNVSDVAMDAPSADDVTDDVTAQAVLAAASSRERKR